MEAAPAQPQHALQTRVMQVPPSVVYIQRYNQGAYCAPSNRYMDLNGVGYAACCVRILIFWPCAFAVPYVPAFKENVLYTADGVNTGIACD